MTGGSWRDFSFLTFSVGSSGKSEKCDCESTVTYQPQDLGFLAGSLIERLQAPATTCTGHIVSSSLEFQAENGGESSTLHIPPGKFPYCYIFIQYSGSDSPSLHCDVADRRIVEDAIGNVVINLTPGLTIILQRAKLMPDSALMTFLQVRTFKLASVYSSHRKLCATFRFTSDTTTPSGKEC